MNEIWRSIRAMRATPPAAVTADRERVKVFTTSLEQAEQYFRVAPSMGHETRPVALFYGLSQLGRAIASAAHADRTPELGWKLSGHGIKVPGISQITTTSSLDCAIVRDSGRGSFTQLAEILRSPSLPQPTSILEIFNTLPEAGAFPAPCNEILPALRISEGFDQTRDDWGDWGPPWVIILDGMATSPKSIAQFLENYRAVWPLNIRPNGSIKEPKQGPPGQIYLPLPRTYNRGGFASGNGRLYRSSLYVFPSLCDEKDPLHPFLSWWAVLFFLSMLARYEPVAWSTIIDVDQSRFAVPIENLLDNAIDALPEVGLSVIREISTSDEEHRAARSRLLAKISSKDYNTVDEMIKTAIMKLRTFGPGGRP